MGRSASRASSACHAQVFFLGLRLIVESDLANADDPLFADVERQQFHDRIGELLVIRLFGIQSDRAVVLDPELACAESLEADEGVEVVFKGPHFGARLPLPERGLDRSR
jgi:hypothetical protein